MNAQGLKQMQETSLPSFSTFNPQQVEPALDAILQANLAEVERLLDDAKPYTWDSLMRPLELMDDHLNSMWSIVAHLHSVLDSKELRKVYNACLPKLSEYATHMSHNKRFYEAVVEISTHNNQQLDQARRQVIHNDLRDFKLAGVALEEKAKKRFAELQTKLSQSTSKFEENLLDATQGWSKLVSDEKELQGLSENAKKIAQETAKRQNLSGWLFTLDLPSYQAVLTYADNRKLREEMYCAYITRASDQGPNAGKWDNTAVMYEILAIRHEMATLLGFKNFAEYSLTKKMAKTEAEVLDFLNNLAAKSLPKAREEFAELGEFAKQEHGIDELAPWDIAYYSEKLCMKHYAVSQEELRPYFPEDRVLSGMFAVIQRLYGMQVKEMQGVDVWHPDVKFFHIIDAANNLRGMFYLDIYARPHKRGGAWMDDCRVRMMDAHGKVQAPIAYLTCNFNPPAANVPALLTHDDVLTLFHEFGHGLHHMLTQINYAAVSGINGVLWDAVELPSQFMENWCWQEEVLQLISKHYQTGESLPKHLIDKIRAAKNFQAGMQMVRQLEFSVFDFRLHSEFNNNPDVIQKILNTVRKELSVIPVLPINRFQHSFSHIFGGGYAAGYYSYKWAEVLSSDAFSKFEENGIFDRKTGEQFLHEILEKGGSEPPMKLFVNFRGREPRIDALLKHCGIM